METNLLLSPKKPTSDMGKMQGFTRLLNSSKSLRTILQYFVVEVARLTNADSASILMHDPNRDGLTIYVSSNHGHLDFDKVLVPIDDSIAGRIFASNESFFSNDVTKEPNWFANIDSVFCSATQSIAGAPLWLNGRSLGVIEAINHEDNAFTNDHLILLEMVADLICVAFDRSRIKQTLIKTKKLVANLDKEKAELVEKKEDFLKLTSHELRTPLTIIVAYLSSLLDDFEGNDDLSYRLNAMQNACNRLENKIESLLDLKKLNFGDEIIERRHVVLTDILHDLLAEKAIEAQAANIHLECALPKKPAVIFGEPHLLKVVFESLIDNALKFTPENGRVFIGLEYQGHNVCVYVTDNGIGIPQEEQTQIFEPFYQVSSDDRRQFNGMGIGLAVVKGLVQLNQGHIWVETPDSGQGITFNVNFPILEHAGQLRLDL